MISARGLVWLLKAFVVSLGVTAYYLSTVPVVARFEMVGVPTGFFAGAWLLLGSLSFMAVIGLGLAACLGALDRMTSWLVRH